MCVTMGFPIGFGQCSALGRFEKRNPGERREIFDERKWLYFQYDLQTVAKPFKKYLKKKGDQDYNVPDIKPCLCVCMPLLEEGLGIRLSRCIPGKIKAKEVAEGT